MFKGLGDLASLMKQASQMKGLVGEMQEKLSRLRVTGTAGGGMVQVEVSGDQKVTACTISDSLAATGDREMLCLLYTSPSPRDQRGSRMPSSA